MIFVSILEAEDFGDELYPVMRDNLKCIIEQYQTGVIVAAGDSKGMIFRLLTELAIEYPIFFCNILLSNDKLAYEGGTKDCPHIFSLDPDIAYGDPSTAKQKRRESLIDHSDIIFCRKKYCNEIRKRNRYCDIMVI